MRMTIKLLWRKSRHLSLKPNIEYTKMDFYSVLIPTILSTDIFDKNEDLKILVDKFIVEKPLLEYLYGNRTSLIARLIREIEKLDESALLKNIDILKDFLNEIFEESQEGNIELKNAVNFINKYSRSVKVED